MRTWDYNLQSPMGAIKGGDEIKLTLKFITPVFGGGVEPKNFDPITPVRASAIRGQLRFWWRATSPLSNVSKLLERENEIFGGVHGGKPKPSQVQVAVTRQPRPPRRKPIYEDGSPFRAADGIGKGLAYGAFPLRATEQPLRHDQLFEYAGDFEVVLRVPTSDGAREEVCRALGAFLHFGGLGGRTRRGFGAMELLSGFDLTDIEHIPSGSAEAPWPTYVQYERSQGTGSAVTMHESALRALFSMRQGLEDGRRKKRNESPPFGRSCWPEADEIRSMFGGFNGRHRHRLEFAAKFPRAAFGAPIEFHFMDEGYLNATLYPVKGGIVMRRLASPLIVRPWRDPEYAGNYRALAVRLRPGYERHKWRLSRDGVDHSVQVVLTQEETGTPGQDRGVRPLCGIPDPIDAYFVRLKKIGGA